MDFVGEADKENGSTNKESLGEHFVHRVASSGLVVKFKVDKYMTHPSESDIPIEEVGSSDKENARDPNTNFVITCAQNVAPLLEQSEIKVKICKDEIPFLGDAKMAHADQGINRAMKVDSSTMVADSIIPLKESITEGHAAIKLNETSSSENDKMDGMENMMTANYSPKQFEVMVPTENGSSRSNVHICYRCGKSFEKKISLDGHIGTHRREDYKHIRPLLKQPIPVDNSQTTVLPSPISNNKGKPYNLENFYEASRALEDMSMAPVWHPKHGTATIDLSTTVTFTSAEHSSGEAAEITEVADFLTNMVKRIRYEVEKAPLPPSVDGFRCRICYMIFSSYQALGGHMSIHKNSLHADGSSSSSGSGENCTPEYICTKCNEKFQTEHSLGGHKCMTYSEEYNVTKSPADGNMQSSGTVVQPTDEDTLPPVLLAINNVQPTRTEQLVANATVHQPLPQAFDAVYQPQHANRLVKETEPQSDVLDLKLQPHQSDDT